jgi:hypothetical protein
MPKRIVDGEGVWRSEKIARITPDWMRAEYANLLPLALANGVFELDSRRIWSVVYSYNRPDINVADVEQILHELERVGLLFRFFDGTTAKTWGFWTGIDKQGRLPSQSRLQRKHETTGPTPPPDALQDYVQRTANQWLANGEVGLGLGSGLGPGKNIIVPEIRGDSASAEHRRREKVLPLPSTDPERQALDRIWAYYLERLEKNPKLLSFTEKRRQKATARYRECLAKSAGDAAKAEALMKVAIDNLTVSDYHRQNGYDSFEGNLFPSREKLEWWLDRPEKAVGAAS